MTDRSFKSEPWRAAAAGPGMRDIVGAWLVCLAIAAGSFSLLAATAVPHAEPEALITPVRAATVAAFDIARTTPKHERRC